MLLDPVSREKSLTLSLNIENTNTLNIENTKPIKR